MEDPEHCLTLLNWKESELRELSIENCSLICATFWSAFFENGIPTLESLTWMNGNPFKSLSIGQLDFATAFPALKRLRLSVGGRYCLKIGKLPPNLKYLELSGLPVFDRETADTLAALTDSASSIEELSIDAARCTNPSNEVKSLWGQLMRRFTNLRAITIERGHYDSTDWGSYVYLIEQIPNVSAVKLIGNSSLSQSHIKSIVKKPNISSIEFQVAVIFNTRLYDSMVSHREEWHHDSPPLVIRIDCARINSNQYYGNIVPRITDYSTKSKRIRLQYF